MTMSVRGRGATTGKAGWTTPAARPPIRIAGAAPPRTWASSPMTFTVKAARERRPPQPTRRKPAMFKGSALLGSPALPKHPSTLGGKVAVVTGSTRGIGLGIAQALARLGPAIFLNGFGEHSNPKATRPGIERETSVRAV